MSTLSQMFLIYSDFSFLFGFLTSFVILPHVNFSEEDRIAKLVVQIACGVLSVVLFALLFIVFYLAQVISYFTLIIIILL